MNHADTVIFETIEKNWIEYFSKCEVRDEIPLRSDGLMSKMQTYHGDLPQGGLKPDIMPGMIDKYRKFHITEQEHFAFKIMMAVPKPLRPFVMIEPLIRNKPNPKTGKKPSQEFIAAYCDCTIDYYKKRRARAKEYLVLEAKKHTLLELERVRTEVRKTVRTSDCVPQTQSVVVISSKTYFTMENVDEQ